MPSKSWGLQGPVELGAGSPGSRRMVAPCRAAALSSVRLPSHSWDERATAQEDGTGPGLCLGLSLGAQRHWEVDVGLLGELGCGICGDTVLGAVIASKGTKANICDRPEAAACQSPWLARARGHGDVPAHRLWKVELYLKLMDKQRIWFVFF